MKEESIKAKQLAEESRLMWVKEKYEWEEARRLEDRLEARLEKKRIESMLFKCRRTAKNFLWL
jgi:hypothetical protein